MDMSIAQLEHVLVLLMAVAATLGFFAKVGQQTLDWLRRVRSGEVKVGADTVAGVSGSLAEAAADAKTAIILTATYQRWRATDKSRRFLELQEILHRVTHDGNLGALSYPQVQRWMRANAVVVAETAHVAMGGGEDGDAQTFFTMLGSALSWPVAVSFEVADAR